MNIEEAIEINKKGWGTDKQMKEARQLGIEALEAIKTVREDTEQNHSIHYLLEKLPGETE